MPSAASIIPIPAATELRITDHPRSGTGGSGRPLTAPTVEQVLDLQSRTDFPAVSLLMNTIAGRRMQQADVATLRGLAADATKRLRRIVPAQTAVEDALAEAVDQAANGPVDAAIAVLVSAHEQHVLPLPVHVHDRAVVDTTFATRDLVRALHRTPRHVVLVFNAGQARLFDSVGGVLHAASADRFPLHAPDRQPGGTQTTKFLQQVDTALGVHLRLHPAPLILVGSEHLVATFRSLSRNTARLAGTVSGNLAKASLPELARRVQPILDTYLHSRQSEALELLATRARAGTVVTGVPAAWLAARHERPEMLVVEEGLFYPAHLSDDGDFLTPATTVGAVGVIDDAVDELIELALRRGAWVALTEDGALGAYDRVALTVRPKR